MRFIMKLLFAYHSAYLCVRIWIPEQYYIYPIPMLQTGIGFVALRVGHKKCSTVNRTYLARAARQPLALDTRFSLYDLVSHVAVLGLYGTTWDSCTILGGQCISELGVQVSDLRGYCPDLVGLVF